MSTYENENIKKYAKKMPSELKRAVSAMGGDLRLAVFFVLFKYGEMPFSQIMKELDIPPEYSSQLTYHIKKLQKAGLVKNEYIRKENTDSYSFYDVTGFGEDFINSLMKVIEVRNIEHASSSVEKSLRFASGDDNQAQHFSNEGKSGEVF